MCQIKSAKIYSKTQKKKIITVCNAVYFRLCIVLMHILPPVTAEGFDGLPSPEVCRMIDDIYCDRIHYSLNAVRCFDNGCVEKQPVAWKEYCVEYWLKKTPGKHG